VTVIPIRWLMAALVLGPGSVTRQQTALELVGGQWFDGEGFVAQTFYSVNGVLTSVRPPQVDSVLDLTGKFVIPPFADAHVHNLNDDASIDDDIKTDLARGVFYAMEMDPAIELSPRVLGRVNKPASVDVIYTQGLVTPSWGVMPDMYRMLARMGRFGKRTTLAQLDGREIFLIDGLPDLEKKWSALAARNHDFIKVIVAFSEEEDLRKNNSTFGAKVPAYSAKPGIAPSVLPQLVRLAHAAGLRVAAHIETAADFRLALRSGVDVIAHLPASWQIGPKTGFRDGSVDHWELTDSDAALAAAQGVVVVTTIVKQPHDPDAATYRQVYRHNLRMLQRHMVRVVIGTDMRGSAVDEVLYIASLDVFDNRTLLNMLTRATAQAIFPGRRIGALRDGYEASFLALDANPIETLDRIRHIAMRVKQGGVIHIPDSTASQ
jgi:imidazolonepropionase-like amidohydrolase